MSSQLLLTAGITFDEAIAPIYSSLVRILGKAYRNHPEAEDLIQEGIVYLWEHWKLNTQLFDQYPLRYIVGMAKRGGAGRYFELMNGRAKFDGGSLDDPENLKRPSVQKKLNGGHGREVQMADIRLDLSAAAQIIHHRYQTMHNTQFNAKKRAQLDTILRDFLDDRPPAETALALNMQPKSILRWHRDFRVAFRELLPDYGEATRLRPHYTTEEVTRLLTLVMEGFTYRQIARQLDRPIDSVSSKFYLLRNQQLGLTGD